MKNILIIVIAAVVGVVGGGVGGYFLANHFNPANQATLEEEAEFDLKDGASLALNDVKILLKKAEGSTKTPYLQASFVIVFKDADALTTAENMTEFYRDAILSVLELKTKAELSSENARNEIKEPILQAVRELYNSEEDREKIVKVMIPSFILGEY